MPSDLCALTTTVLAWHSAGWMWLWGGMMVVVWAAITGTLAWMATLPTETPPPSPPDEPEHHAASRDRDLVHS